MRYTPILLKDGTVYMVGTPEYATEKPLCLQDEVILELQDKINELTSSIKYIESKVHRYKRSNARANQVIDFIELEINKANKILEVNNVK